MIGGKKGGGLVLYVKDCMCEYLSTIDDYCSMPADLEQLWVCINEPNLRKKIIGVVYRPPAGNVEKKILISFG